MRKKILLIAILFSTVLLVSTTKVNAAYNYTPWQGTIESAHSMNITRRISSVNLLDTNGELTGIIFDDLKDSFVHEDYLYVVDAKVGKVYQLNNEYQYVKQFPKDDSTIAKLNNPQGIFVTGNLLYVADTDNDRIVAFNIETGNLVKQVKKPTDEIFENLPFKPQKLVVDRVGRIMVVSRDMYEGIIEFDENGKFTRFLGTNTIQLSFLESLIYAFSSKKQKEKMALNLQTPFTSVDMDEYGYLYVVAKNETSQPVKKLNFKGQNILNNNGYIPVVGDTRFPTWRENVALGPSSIIDIASHKDNNRFSILDSNRGRIFTYDMEGHLLYIFGGIDAQSNQLQAPTSVTYWGEKVVVTDNIAKSVYVFEPTEFGEVINEATTKYYNMEYEESRKLWERVIALNSNYFLAYAGVGKTQLRNQEWKDAVENLKLGHDYYNYSKAYEQYRNEKISAFVPYVIVIVLLGSGYGIFSSIRASVKREKGESENE